MKYLIWTIPVILFAVSCSQVKEKTKETLNEGGEVVGKSATEFFEGVSEGVDRTLESELVLSDALKQKGLETGKFAIGNDTAGGSNNLVTVYVIFNSDYKGDVSIKAFDKTGLEMGRTKGHIEGKTGEAKYYDFAFDKRTDIEVRSRITIE